VGEGAEWLMGRTEEEFPADIVEGDGTCDEDDDLGGELVGHAHCRALPSDRWNDWVSICFPEIRQSAAGAGLPVGKISLMYRYCVASKHELQKQMKRKIGATAALFPAALVLPV